MKELIIVDDDKARKKLMTSIEEPFVMQYGYCESHS